MHTRGITSDVVGYEARPTRMFGAYVVWVNHADGSGRQIAHGEPAFCLREAERLNAALAQDRGRAGPSPEAAAITPGIRQDLDAQRWHEHRFGLPADRWRNLAGRRFWIIGGGTGFGRAIATALAAADAAVFLTGRREKVLTEAIEAMRPLRIDPARCRAVASDITDVGAITAAARRIASEPDGQLHGLVVCAALPQPRESPWPLVDLPPEAWNRLIATNITGQLNVARAALRAMVATGAVRAVFLTSEAGWASTPGVGPYNVTKAALNSLVASLAAETARRCSAIDVQINALDPGEALTEMNRGATTTPYAAVPMLLALLSHPAGGPNGRFFHRDGRHRAFAYAEPWTRSLLENVPSPETSGRLTRVARRLGLHAR